MLNMRMMMVMAMMVVPIAVLAGASDMVVMADLRLAHRLFEPRQTHPVFAEFAVHIRTALHRLVRTLDKDIQEQGMRVEIIGTQKVRIRMLGGEFQRLTPNPFFKYACKKKKWKDDDALEPHPMATRQRLGQEGGRDADITRGGPTQSHAFPQQAGQFLDIGIGIGIAAAASHHEQERILALNGRGAAFYFSDFQRAKLNDIRM
jgi:hypothetical protein